MSLVTPLLYQSHMSEVKHRLHAIDRVLGAKKPRMLSVEMDDEFMWLQLRQIIELITFSAMLADEERYAALRKTTEHEDAYRQDWRAGKILEKLSRISPHFLPQALGPLVEVGGGIKEYQGTQLQATLDQFVSIHQMASEHLHAANPADVEGLFDQAARRIASRSMIIENVAYLKAIVWDHFKVGLAWNSGASPIEAQGPTRVWIVRFGRSDSRDVQMILATAEEIGTTPATD